MRATIRLVRDPELLALALEGLIEESRVQIRRGAVGRLYESYVRYQQEPPGRENWQTADETSRSGVGDCEDLVIWRVAELREDGDEDARPTVIPLRPKLWHVVVQHGDGSLEDPSALLGMYTWNALRKGRHPLMDNTEANAATATEARTDAALEVAAVESQAAATANVNPSAPSGAGAGLDPATLADLAHADANAATMERSAVPIRPSVRWQTVPRRDGTHEASITIRLRDGRAIRPVVHARTRRGALARCAALARKAMSNREVQALIPGEAILAVNAIRTLAHVARAGKLAALARRMTSRGLMRVAKALL